MTTVFISGSRSISRLNEAIRRRLANIMDQNFRIVVGDANGADKSLQRELADAHYPNVEVFCAGQTCRNNLGSWGTRHITPDIQIKGRDFYTAKDKAMAAEADYGFVIWNGKSIGSLRNAIDLLNRGKMVVLYLAPSREFIALKNSADLAELFGKLREPVFGNVLDEIRSDKTLRSSVQGALNF